MSKRKKYGKSINVEYKVVKNLTKARFEFLKVFVENARYCNQKQLCELFKGITGYSDNYGTECFSKLRPILKAIVEKKFDVDYIKIPIESIAKYFNSKPIIPGKKV